MKKYINSYTGPETGYDTDEYEDDYEPEYEYKARKKKRPIRRGIRLIRHIILLIIACALVFSLVNFQSLLGFFTQNRYRHASILISEKMEQQADFVTAKLTKDGQMYNDTTRAIIGTVQTVSLIYRYEIGYGVDLREIQLTVADDALVVALPPIRRLYDSFDPQGDPAVTHSIFYSAPSETEYQNMLLEEKELCRTVYETNEEYLQQAWDFTCETLTSLFRSWCGDDTLTIRFVQIEQEAAT